MKKLFVGIMLVSLMFGRFANAIECTKDSFYETTTCIYSTALIKNFSLLSVLKTENSNTIYFNLMNTPETWELHTQSKIILFKIDGVLHEKEYKLRTEVKANYVIENVALDITKEFLSLIANSKECKIRVGCCKETFIKQRHKDGMKKLLLK